MSDSPDRFKLTKPCAECPFRTDVKPYLTKARVDQLDGSLRQSSFYCHKTIEYSVGQKGEEVHCAGALILLEKMGRPSQMMRIAERLGLYDRAKLDKKAPVFKNFRQMRKAQPE